jgi:hypothetical protein
MVRITSLQEGFRRCGVAHPAGATDYPDDRFTKAELAILKAEPVLLVEELSDPSDKSQKSDKPLNVQETVALVNTATVEELDKLAEGETRKGVLDAIEKRRAALSAPPASEPSEPSEPSDQHPEQ